MASRRGTKGQRELPVRPEEIAAAIAQAIREGIYSPGDALIQEDLAQRFRVSRSPVREALRILAAEGTVVMPPGGQGASVRRRSAQELAEIYDLRITLEHKLASSIVANAGPRTLTRLRSLADEISQTEDVSTWMRHNFEFHSQLLVAAERPITSEILIGLLSASQPYSRENIEMLGGQRQADVEHHEMLDAIEAADVPRLSDVLSTHLTTAKERLLAHYAKDEDDPLRALWAPTPESAPTS